MNTNLSFFSLVFLLSISAQAQIFLEGHHIPGTFPSCAAFGDFNGDGHIDFVQGYDAWQGSSQANANKIWLNNGDTTFTFHDSFGIHPTQDIEVTDIDNDGDLDIISANIGINTVKINDGNANFTDGQFLGGTETSVVVIADFNEDGYQDVFLGSKDYYFEDTLYLNQGNGQLVIFSVPWTTGATTRGAEAVDINSDGHMDLIISRGYAVSNIDQENEVLLGNGDGTFFKSPQMLPLINSEYMAVGDYNGDGYIDLIFSEANGVNGYLNDGTTLFQNGDEIYTELWVRDLELVDVDYDQDLDLIVGRTSGTNGYDSVVLLNDGSGNFTSGVEQLSVDDTLNIEPFDIDQDNDIDLLIINMNHDDSVFLINQTDPILSIGARETSSLFLYPNPTRDFIKIGGDTQNSISNYEIYSSHGIRISIIQNKDENTVLDFSDLPNGVYFCTINSSQELSETFKFIKY